MKANQLLHAAIHALAPGAPIESFVEDDIAVGQMMPGAAHLPVEGVLPSFDGATAWLNSPPLTPACAARSSSSTSGPTRASIGSALRTRAGAPPAPCLRQCRGRPA